MNTSLPMKIRVLLGALVFVVVFEFAALAALATPQAAYALIPTTGPDVVAELRSEEIEKKIDLKWQTVAKMAFFQALLNATTYFLQKIAYDTAVWASTGFQGQNPFAYGDNWYDYLGKEALESVGEFVGSLSQGLNIPGLNLCDPSISVLLKIQLGLRAAYLRPSLKCSWNQISSSYSRSGLRQRGTDALRNSGLQFEPGQAPLSVALQLNRQVFTEELKATNAATNERLDQGPFRAVTDSITGRIKTPSAVVQNRFDAALETGKTLNEVSISGAYANSEVGIALAQTVISTFANTLATKLLDKVMGGFFPLSDLFGGDPLDFELAQPPGSRREQARQLFASLQTAPIRSIERFDLLGEFTSCPDSPGPMNCVVDEAFATAVRLAAAGAPLTLRQAMDQNPPLIRGDWPLWPPSSLDKNQDENCYRSAFCYANLVKLRRARIIPVGWELAAMRSESGNPITLAEVIAGYDNCTEDGSIGDDDATRWCHLIDPNWVLKYPLTQCRQLGPGATLLDPSGDGRAEVCVDMPSCNATDDDGNCIGGWGYCTRERNLWRFDGDQCPAHAASCQVMQNSASERISVLTNTADFGVCTADNAGCRSYSTLPRPADPLGWDASASSRIYLNGRAAECDASGAGCTELVPKRGGVTFNLARNSSFEEDTRDPVASPDFWDGTTTAYGAPAASGANGVRFVGATRLSQRITVQPNQFYTISFSARRAAAAAGAARATLSLRNASGTDDGLALASFFRSASCGASAASSGDDLTDTSLPADGENDAVYINKSVTTDTYERASCTFTTPATARYLYLTLSAASGDVWIDAVQFEENEFASSYGNGYSGAGAGDRSWLKLPPPDLCTGGEDDPALCDDYAQVCAATEVGCEGYTPLSGEPAVTGVARGIDACPAACVGYETFREEPTAFNPDGDYPLHFIPTSADRCSVANAGCDEFTNLDAGAGAEARNYFTFLRLCEEPVSNDDTATYYTWEGTEDEGFQLRVWQLKESNLSFADAIIDPTGGRAPCTAYNAQNGTCRDDDGLDDDDAAASDGAFEPPGLCNAASDIFTNPDCREFYDVDGNIHYRLFSRTILKTTECTDYRKTLALGEDPLASCNNSGGRWQASTGECFYRANIPTSTSCPAAENQCRLYTGNAGRNVELIFEDDFEDGDTLGWDGELISSESLAATGQSMRLAPGATSLRTEEAGGAELHNRTVFISFWARGTAGRTLEVRFENAPAGSATTPALRRYFSYNDTLATTSSAELSSEWRFYELGPVTVDWNIATGEDLIIGAAAGTELFIDNIRLRAVSSVIAVIRDSWETPAMCDATPEGAYSPQEMLGCETYRDRANNEVHLRSFSRLCSPEVVGCEAFFNTHNSTSPYAETWNFTCIRPGRGSGPCSVDPDGTAGPATAEQVCVVAVGRDRCEFRWDNELVGTVENPTRFTPPIILPYIADTTGTDPDGAGGADPATMPFFHGPDARVVPADSTVYVVDDPAKRCRPDLKGCQALGLPVFDQTLETVESFEVAHRLNLPDRYNEFLCTNEALFCEAWRDTDNSEWYFKNPQEKTCEWRETGPGGTSGWFRSGGDEPCYGNFVATGSEYGIWGNRAVCALTDGPDVGGVTSCNIVGGCSCPGNDSGGRVGTVVQCTVNRGENTCSPYEGWVGTCEEQNNACTEFLDPQDTDQNAVTGAPRWPAGRPHYVIENAALDESQRVPTERCEGQVSLNEGCALFNDTSESVLQWNSAATYLKSAADNFGLVSPVNCASPGADVAYCAGLGGANDANRIIKVRRDRECAEWLACDQPEEVWDPRTSEWKTVCSSLGVCNEALSGGLGECRQVIDKPEPAVLSPAVYSGRDISWTGKEYSGYSIPGQYPVDALEPIDVGVCVVLGSSSEIPGINTDPQDFGCNEDNEPTGDNCASKIADGPAADRVDADKTQCDQHFRLGRVFGTCPESASQGTSCIIGTCTDGDECNPTDLEACDEDPSDCDVTGAQLVGAGQCYSGQCAVPPDGVLTDPSGDAMALSASASALAPQCRIYPEIDAPFSNLVVNQSGGEDRGWLDRSTDPDQVFLDEPFSVSQGFQNAKLCARGENCECSYQKVAYANGVNRYYGAGNSGVSGVCSGGTNNGGSCAVDSACPGDGSCDLRTRADSWIGLPGFCLEQDLRTSINGQKDQYGCLSWYPVDRIAGAPDLFNQFADAGWNPSVQQEWYCAQGSWNIPGATAGYPQLDVEVSSEENYSPSYFGSPAHVRCNPAGDINWNSATPTDSCIFIFDGPAEVGHLEQSGDPDRDQDCEEEDDDMAGGAWCLWPQYYCPDGQNQWGDDEHDDGANGDGVFCSRDSTNVTGPNGAFGTFLGCYEITSGLGDDDRDDWPGMRESGFGTIRFPWVGPLVYAWQVKEFEVEFGDADTCSGFTNESFAGIGANAAFDAGVFRFPPTDTDEINLQFRDSGDDADVGMYAVWDNVGDDGLPTENSTLKAITVLADKVGGEASIQFYIRRFSIRYWPGCYFAAHVGGTNSAAFTDRVMLGHTPAGGLFPGAGDAPSFTTGNEPWGSVCLASGENPSTLIVNNTDFEIEISGDSCLASETDMLYRELPPPQIQLRRLFARSVQVLQFLPAFDQLTHRLDATSPHSSPRAAPPTRAEWAERFTYGTSPSAGTYSWDVTETSDGGASNAPQIRAVGRCDITGTCNEIDLEGLTINNGTAGTIEGVRQLRAQLRFFAFASSNRMPIKRVVVDWGDEDGNGQTVVDGLMKNHRGQCSDGEDVEFGLTSAACEAKPFTFVKDYKCSQIILNDLQECSDLDVATGGRHVGAYQAGGGVGGCKRGNACVYVPRVMVIDNWGWCTGDCPDAPGGAGCYDGSQNNDPRADVPTSTSNECNNDLLPRENISATSIDESQTDPWVYFRGEIVVEAED